MHITPVLLAAFASTLRQHGKGHHTIQTMLSDIRSAERHIPGPWDTTTDLAPFVNASTSQQVRYNRRSALTRFARWAALHGHGTITVPTIAPVPARVAPAPAPDVDLAHLIQRIRAAALPIDVQAIFLLLAEGGLMPRETLMLNLGDVSITRTGSLLLVGNPVRPYPLTTVHTPATIPVVLAWSQERRAARAADHEALFLTRQYSRRSQMSLRAWWQQVVGETGLERRAVAQARRAELQARYPTITPSLFGAHGAPAMSADAVRQVVLAGATDDA